MLTRRIEAKHRAWLLAGSACLLAAGLGFGVARITAPAPAQTAAQKPAGKPSEGRSAEGVVKMDAAKLRLSGIQLVTTAGGALSSEITLQGNVAAQPQGEAVLAARADGVVTRIDRRIGEPVRAGEPIALIESRDAAAMAAERSSASARAIAARQNYERERRLFAEGISPRQDLEAAQATRAEAEAELRRTTAAAAASRVSGDGRSVAVVSPIPGRITAAPAVLGAYVTAGAELFRVADPGRVEIRAAAPAADAARIAAGDQASVVTPAGLAPAVVRSITPSVDTETRAATVVLALTGDAQGFKQGQAVRVRLTPSAGASATTRVVVPDEAVQSVGGRDVVFVRTTDGFKAAPVTVGARSAGRAEVTAGLLPGQSIAGRGAFLLKAELGKGEAEHGH